MCPYPVRAFEYKLAAQMSGVGGVLNPLAAEPSWNRSVVRQKESDDICRDAGNAILDQQARNVANGSHRGDGSAARRFVGTADGHKCTWMPVHASILVNAVQRS